MQKVAIDKKILPEFFPSPSRTVSRELKLKDFDKNKTILGFLNFKMLP
jgi:hypothetical protein